MIPVLIEIAPYQIDQRFDRLICAVAFGADVQHGSFRCFRGHHLDDALGIVKVMATKAPQDAIIYFRSEGSDADAAVAALVTLVEQDFDA
jgi:hypothetical protein